ncbi:MAG: glycerol-3-phosphate dehydrogenase/oxidase [Gemmatimonadaceae bacterium]|nr:glycerol-3-phosphate dehydrogenase/oxidase [Gemmatimonadaceae bacterium]
MAEHARRDLISQLMHEHFDVVVVGGGITGAGIAREAALAGRRVALIERDDFACGTSSRSSRLVHGGVRYLEHGHLGLVFESSRERRLLLALAPHLVRPLAFTWPVYRGARVPRWKLRAGLLMYDALALFRNVHRHEGLSANDVLTAEPGLDRTALVGGARYWDAATDDTRLTLSTALAARNAGAVVVNHVDVIGGLRTGNSHTLSGVRVRDNLADEEFDIQGTVVINATGPWSDATASITGAAERVSVRGSAGTHIAVPRQRLGNRDAITLVSPLDGRVMFVLPAGAHAIIGTTERPASQSPDEIRATESEVAYLLRSVNARFPHASLTENDVISAWAGIRPLAATRAGGHSANSASREHAILTRDDGLVSVTGGKLTTYRAMAADVLAHATRALPTAPHRPAVSAPLSATTPIVGGDIGSFAAVLRDIRSVVTDAAVAERLAAAYGSRWRVVWHYTEQDATLGERLSAALPYLLAEVVYAVEHEMACTLADILVRRMHLAFETRDHGRAAAARITPIVGALLGWSEQQCAAELSAFDATATRLFRIESV